MLFRHSQRMCRVAGCTPWVKPGALSTDRSCTPNGGQARTYRSCPTRSLAKFWWPSDPVERLASVLGRICGGESAAGENIFDGGAESRPVYGGAIAVPLHEGVEAGQAAPGTTTSRSSTVSLLRRFKVSANVRVELPLPFARGRVGQVLRHSSSVRELRVLLLLSDMAEECGPLEGRDRPNQLFR